MKRKWVKSRVFVSQTDGEQRWDRAYQYLLLWTKEMELNRVTNSGKLSQEIQEVDHVSSSICAGLHKESS